VSVQLVLPVCCCVQCVTSRVRLSWKCPYDDCSEPVQEDSERLRDFEEELLFLFPSVDDVDVELPEGDDSGQEMMYVATLSGETQPFIYSADMTVAELKMKIKLKMEVSASQQRLMYNTKELEVSTENALSF